MFFRIVLAAAAALFLASCGSMKIPMSDLMYAHRIEIQQGNFVSQEMVAQLKLGMTKEQVRFIMGTPLITDSFHGDRWDYVFRRQKANSRELEQSNLAVFFEDGKLKRIEGDNAPAAAIGTKAPEARPAAATAPPSTPVAPTANEAPKPAPTADAMPAEKSWWERLKEKLTPK
jgi:outer membrane protein assembly factor BamE